MILQKRATSLAAVAALGLMLGAAGQAKAAIILSGAAEFATTNTGAQTGEIWNTQGLYGNYNLYLLQGGPNGAFLNPGQEADPTGLSPNIDLSVPGTYTFGIRGDGAGNQPFYGLNLFFNGDQTNPGISVFAPLQTDPGTVPAFSANSSPQSKALNGGLTPGSGALSFSDGTVLTTITDYRWASTGVFSSDLIATFSANPNGINDNVGQFTVVTSAIAAVPEPSTYAMFGLGLLAIVALQRRKRKEGQLALAPIAG